MSISSKNKHKSFVTDLSSVSVPSSWLDAIDEAEVAILTVGSRTIVQSSHGGGVTIHGVRVVTACDLLLSHEGPVGIEGLVCVLDDEGVLHLKTGWAHIALVLTNIVLLVNSLHLQVLRLDCTLLGGRHGWVNGLAGLSWRAEVVVVRSFHTWGFFTVFSIRVVALLSVVAGSGVLAAQLPGILFEVEGQKFVELLCQLEDATEDKHFSVEDRGAVSTSWAWYIRVTW